MTAVTSLRNPITGRIMAVTVQNVSHIGELEYVSPSTGEMEGPLVTFYIAEDSDREDVYVCLEGTGLWRATSEEHSWRACQVALENLRTDLESKLNLTSSQIDDLIFYIAANHSDEAEDIDNSAFTHELLSSNDAGEINAAEHFETAEEAGKRVWVSTAASLDETQVTPHFDTLTLEFNAELLDQKEVISWSKKQI